MQSDISREINNNNNNNNTAIIADYTALKPFPHKVRLMDSYAYRCETRPFVFNFAYTVALTVHILQIRTYGWRRQRTAGITYSHFAK
jgi:hypothetical protein